MAFLQVNTNVQPHHQPREIQTKTPMQMLFLNNWLDTNFKNWMTKNLGEDTEEQKHSPPEAGDGKWIMTASLCKMRLASQRELNQPLL